MQILFHPLVIFGIGCFLTMPSIAQTSERRSAIEQGLLPAVLVEGRDTTRYSIYERMQRFNVPGVSIAVINDGRFEWAEGYGVKRAGGSDSVHTSTHFQAASISKPVAAVGALLLVDEGRLSLDADVNKLLESWKVPANDSTTDQRVTLRGLLSHTAGATVHGFPGYPPGATVPSTIDVLDGIGNTAPVVIDTVPGSIWRYSGGGYTIAQLLVADVTDLPFAAYMREALLSPLGMYESTFEQPLPENLADDAATAHDWDGVPIEGDWHTYPEQAAAGLWTTPTDLARFALAFTQALNGESDPILSKELANEALTRVVSDDYGLGFGIIGEGDELRFSHGGANAGYRTYFAMYPRTGDGIAVMTNSDNGGDLTSEIMRAVSDVYGWPHVKPEIRPVAVVDPDVLARYEGVYLVEPGFEFSIRSDGDRLLVDGTRRHPEEMYPESKDTFFGADINMRFRFNEDDDGRIGSLSILRGKNEIEIRAAKIR